MRRISTPLESGLGPDPLDRQRREGGHRRPLPLPLPRLDAPGLRAARPHKLRLLRLKNAALTNAPNITVAAPLSNSLRRSSSLVLSASSAPLCSSSALRSPLLLRPPPPSRPLRLCVPPPSVLASDSRLPTPSPVQLLRSSALGLRTSGPFRSPLCALRVSV
jgi:hypothetical protein